MAAFVLALSLSGVTQDVKPASPTVTEYVTHALDLMQQHSINRRKIDWASLRRETLARAVGAQTTYDTYDAIRFALKGLDDHHSFLQLSDALARQDQESHARRGVVPSKETNAEKWPPSPYIDRRTPEGQMITIEGAQLALVVVPLPGIRDEAHLQDYAKTLQTQIEILAKQHPLGWIIDLRGNLGGNMWPILAGIAPLLDVREVGGFIDAEGHKNTWFISPEGAGLRTQTRFSRAAWIKAIW